MDEKYKNILGRIPDILSSDDDLEKISKNRSGI